MARMTKLSMILIWQTEIRKSNLVTMRRKIRRMSPQNKTRIQICRLLKRMKLLIFRMHKMIVDLLGKETRSQLRDQQVVRIKQVWLKKLSNRTRQELGQWVLTQMLPLSLRPKFH
jgi:hypothetical protein